LGVPGHEVTQARGDIDHGAESPEHSHPGDEIVYAIEGVPEHQVESEPPATVKVGKVLVIPAEAIHAAKNISSGNGAELAAYVAEKGKPLVVPAE
jgi:quercetin dioxygenase-like cupin family protein